MDDRYYTYADFRAGLDSKETELHTVTDMRTPKRREDNKPRPNERRPRRRRNRGVRGVAMALCVFVLCLSLLLLFADTLLPSGVAGYVVEAFAKEPQAVYAVSAGAYDTLAEARAVSDSVRARGGAGFVAFDGKYNVLLTAYESKTDAVAVADKNGYTIYPILTQGVGLNDFPLAYRAKVKPLIDYHLDVYRTLYDLSDQLAQKGTNVAYCRRRVQGVKEGLEEKAAPFLSATASATDSLTLNYRATLEATTAALDNLVTVSTEAQFLGDLRWTYIMVLRINRV